MLFLNCIYTLLNSLSIKELFLFLDAMICENI